MCCRKVLLTTLFSFPSCLVLFIDLTDTTAQGRVGEKAVYSINSLLISVKIYIHAIKYVVLT